MSIRGSLFVGLFALALVGCEDKKTEKPAEGGDAGALRKSSHGDKNILEAAQAAASAAAQQGPPETGVFAPGAADKELKLGDPPKVVLGAKGAPPLVQLVALGTKPPKKLEGKVEVAIQTGPRSAMPTIELGLTTEAVGKPAEPGASGPVEVTLKAATAKLAAEQPGQLPPGADKTIGQARGSRIKLEVLPNGAGHVKSVEPAKDLDESLALVVRAASDAVAFAFQPYPAEPVGAGGYWMVTSREPYGGLDAVVYRMFKVVEVKPDSVTLDVNVKRFVNKGQLTLPGLPPHQVEEFSNNTTGRIEVLPADTSQIHAQLTDMMGAALSPAGAPAQAQAQGQRMQMQIQIKTRIALGR